MSIGHVVDCLLSRGWSADPDTEYFRRRSHDTLIDALTSYLNTHRRFLGLCRFERTHNLNERGVDLLIFHDCGRIGFQIKSEHDVCEKRFADNVKRQFTEALSHSLARYFILICAPMATYRSKISHLMNEMHLIRNDDYFSIYSPNDLVIPLRDKPTVTRDDLLRQGCVADDALHEYERGYEHLPEVTDSGTKNALKKLGKFGDDWWDTEGGVEAWTAWTAIVQQKQRTQFVNVFCPTLPSDVKHKRELLINSITDLLKKCRACASWDDRSEYKLSSWIEHVPEEMIPYTSIPNLLLIGDRLKEYYRIHLDADAERG